jgi:hypothetical protein
MAQVVRAVELVVVLPAFLVQALVLALAGAWRVAQGLGIAG